MTMKTILLALLAFSPLSALAVDCSAECQYMEVQADGTIYNQVATLKASAADALEARISITAQCKEDLGGRLASVIECR